MSAASSSSGKDLIPLREQSGAVVHSIGIGLATRTAQGKANEDFCGVAVPQEDEAGQKGVMIALADGVSANGAGRIAAEATVRSLLTDYDSWPQAWSAALSLEKLLRATNDWLFGRNRTTQGSHGSLATVSALLLCGSQYHIAHVGDTRIYRLRRGAFVQLTADHTWPGRDMRRVLKRAIGLDNHLVVDFAEGEAREGDVFLLVSDGAWDTLGDGKMRSLLEQAANPQAAADAIVAAACELQATYLGRNDASAIVASVMPGAR